MNHRRLASLFSNLFAVRPLAAPALSALHLDAAGRAFVGNASARQLTVVVHAYASDTAALIAARLLLDDAGMLHDAGSLRVVDRRERPLPAEFAPVGGGLVSWRTMRGNAAPQASWVSGVFYRNNLVWDISANGDETDALCGVVSSVAKRLIDRDAELRTVRDLQNLLPVESDLPAPMRLDAMFGNAPQSDWTDPVAA